MSDKYPSLSPYVYCANNPIKLVDPDGEEVWIPEIDKKGNVTYTAEKGDSFQTFINQFECSKENGENIFSKSKLSTKDFIKEGSKITGEDVKEYTGNDVLKGKWYNMTQNQQASQIKFALMYGEKHNLTVEDQYAINLNDFISGFSTPYDGLVLNNVKIPENGSMINVNMRVWPKGGLTDNKGRIPIYYGGYSGGEGGRSLYFYSAKNPNARNFLPAILITQY